MKFAVVAALFAAASAKVECEPKAMNYQIFDDKECTKFNADITGKGFIEGEDTKYYKMQCQTKGGQGKYSWMFSCSAKGLHEDVWENQTCKGDTVAQLEMPWGECNPVPGQDKMWFKAYTIQ